jgi:hypothetical protein
MLLNYGPGVEVGGVSMTDSLSPFSEIENGHNVYQVEVYDDLSLWSNPFLFSTHPPRNATRVECIYYIDNDISNTAIC